MLGLVREILFLDELVFPPFDDYSKPKQLMYLHDIAEKIQLKSMKERSKGAVYSAQNLPISSITPTMSVGSKQFSRESNIAVAKPLTS
jgi:hypothetical protein